MSKSTFDYPDFTSPSNSTTTIQPGEAFEWNQTVPKKSVTLDLANLNRIIEIYSEMVAVREFENIMAPRKGMDQKIKGFFSRIKYRMKRSAWIDNRKLETIRETEDGLKNGYLFSEFLYQCVSGELFGTEQSVLLESEKRGNIDSVSQDITELARRAIMVTKEGDERKLAILKLKYRLETEYEHLTTSAVQLEAALSKIRLALLDSEVENFELKLQLFDIGTTRESDETTVNSVVNRVKKAFSKISADNILGRKELRERNQYIRNLRSYETDASFPEIDPSVIDIYEAKKEPVADETAPSVPEVGTSAEETRFQSPETAPQTAEAAVESKEERYYVPTQLAENDETYGDSESDSAKNERMFQIVPPPELDPHIPINAQFVPRSQVTETDIREMAEMMKRNAKYRPEFVADDGQVWNIRSIKGEHGDELFEIGQIGQPSADRRATINELVSGINANLSKWRMAVILLTNK